MRDTKKYQNSQRKLKMTSSKTIIDALLEEKLVSVKENTESVLNYKLANKLQEKYEDIAPSVFEAKKAKVTDKDNDSEDDSGETLDPVDKGELKGKHKHRDDKDIDNDGDVDSSDKFLHKRRKAITKAVAKEETGDKAEYQKFFQSALKKFGVTQPDQLDGEKKKAFYNYVDKNWKSDKEKETGKDDPS